MDDTTVPAPAPQRPRLSASALASVLLGGLLFFSWFWISITIFFTGLGSLPALGTGLLLLIPWFLVMQVIVRIERRRAVAVHRISVILPPSRRSRHGGIRGWLSDRWFEFCTGAFWRGVLHHHLAMLAAGAFFTLFLGVVWLGWTSADVALREGPLHVGSLELSRWMLGVISLSCLVLAGLALVLGALADRGLARVLVSGSEEDLRVQLAELVERRQGAVDAASQERLRIERDLHDGVQPRLVNLAMTLGIAKNAISTDPDRAADLVGQAHSEAKAVMTDLRQLARGIHPAVLTDRGLDAALSALAARSRIPVELRVDLSGGQGARLDREREAVAYFLVSEALTNIAKHSEAERAAVTVTQTRDALQVRIEDDGRGGAQVHRDGLSTGLAGLTDRVRATGGRLEVSSPAGGGTVLVAVLPLPVQAAVAPTPAALRPDAQEALR
ncbi:sensor histidine kinase [Brachybacterium alimentarium]|uniref:sensor histidine kinase n=1 Tax=Brachybacterium alimentarium TaxID=47845 RepID=UPI003FD6A97A